MPSLADSRAVQAEFSTLEARPAPLTKLGLNCMTRQTNPKQCNALAAKVPESNEKSSVGGRD